MSYTRSPAAFWDALLEGEALQHIRDEMAAADCAYRHTSGAKISVWPSQYLEVMVALEDRILHNSHVVVAESLVQDVEACISEIPSRCNVRKKASEILMAHVRSEPASIQQLTKTFGKHSVNSGNNTSMDYTFVF